MWDFIQISCRLTSVCLSNNSICCKTDKQMNKILVSTVWVFQLFKMHYLTVLYLDFASRKTSYQVNNKQTENPPTPIYPQA